MNCLSFVSRLAAGQAQRNLICIRHFASSSVLCNSSPSRVKLSTETMSLHNRFLHAMVLSMTVDTHIAPEEDVKLYGYCRHANKGPLGAKTLNQSGTNNSLDQERLTAWRECSQMSQAESQEKYIEIMNSVRVRAGKEQI